MQVACAARTYTPSAADALVGYIFRADTDVSIVMQRRKPMIEKALRCYGHLPARQKTSPKGPRVQVINVRAKVTHFAFSG